MVLTSVSLRRKDNLIEKGYKHRPHVSKSTWLLDSNVMEPDFRVLDLLGEGSFAQVFKCVEKKTKAPFALKEFDTTKDGYERNIVQQEIKIWKGLEHENIVKLYANFRSGKYLYFVMEFMEGGNLFNDMMERHRYSEKEAASILRQVLEALQYLHSKRIVHRDIKPDNILLQSKRSPDSRQPIIAKIGDFGFAVRLPKDSDVIHCQAKGAPMFLAPETILEDPIGCPVDIWSCGVLLHTMIVGYPPFWDDNNEKMLLSAVRGQYSLSTTCWRKVSSSCKDLVKRMLCVSSSQRVTASSALKHPWVFKMSLSSPCPHRKEHKFLCQQTLSTKLKSTLSKLHASMGCTQALGVSKFKGKFFPLHHSAHNLSTLSI
ncbi:calcium/calmodulin-dependent protein kinase type 1 isoform X2 [Exaiptasia diaphana]|uniref:Protein kinase domain-containing protein n=1 Tax=Exaiptasia diaphana TaxID=2652724 RepID=A0A913X0Q5_EXADI|nr:calcium/calmodulin-dependent protein kinase type 1 isoform X2 [Exaiptasia diaphana]